MVSRRNTKQQPRRPKGAAATTAPAPKTRASAAPASPPAGAFQAQAADTAATAILEDARQQANTIVGNALQQFSDEAAATNKANAALKAEADTRAQQVLATARHQAEQAVAEAAAQAAQIRAAADNTALDRQADAELAAQRTTQTGKDRAQRLLEQAQADADQMLADAQAEARRHVSESITASSRTVDAAKAEAAQIMGDARTAHDAARRALEEATARASDVVQQSHDQAQAHRDRVTEEVNGLKAQAVIDRNDGKALRAAAEQAKAEADQRLAKSLSRTARKLEKKALKQNANEQRRQRIEDRKNAQAQNKRTLRASRPTLSDRTRNTLRASARRFMVIGPITAPMAVAWSSQTSYAMDAFHWWLPFALGFAAAWELTTTFTAWMYHEARKDGDDGILYRVMTWVFALGAATMNYAHHCGPGGAPTQPAVAFAAMSLIGMLLWEMYAALLHRRYLRAKKLIPAARPRLGRDRWMQSPRRAWTARALMIDNPARYATADHAWTVAGTIRRAANADLAALRSGLTVHRVLLPAVRSTDHGPAAIPTLRTATVQLTVDRTAVRSTVARPAVDRTAKELDPATADRADRTGPAAHTRSGPDRTAKSPTAGPGTPDRTGPSTDRADRTAEPQLPTGPDRTADTELVLTDLETRAVELLRSTNRSISKRSICAVVRTELNGSIATDRAGDIARHFRTQLRVA